MQFRRHLPGPAEVLEDGRLVIFPENSIIVVSIKINVQQTARVQEPVIAQKQTVIFTN